MIVELFGFKNPKDASCIFYVYNNHVYTQITEINNLLTFCTYNN